MATQQRKSGSSEQSQNGPAAGEPDVVLDVEQLKVEEINLEVDNLRARIALQVRLADLLQLGVGADVEIERVALEIKGVEAEASLTTRLHNVLAILDRALGTVDKNPELLGQLAGTLDESVMEQLQAATGGDSGDSGDSGDEEKTRRRSRRQSSSNGDDSGSRREKAESS